MNDSIGSSRDFREPAAELAEQSSNGSGGRPTKYIEETVKILCDKLAEGFPNKAACAAAGIGVQTFSDWRKAYPEFAQRVDQAREVLRGKALATIGKAIEEGDWRAAEAAMKLCMPDEYRTGSKVEVSATATATTEVVYDKDRLIELQECRKAQLAELDRQDEPKRAEPTD